MPPELTSEADEGGRQLSHASATASAVALNELNGDGL